MMVMEFAKIWATTIVLACAYGISHDQVTAHLCIEYFTVAHQDIFPTESATLLAIGWGIIATWWVGAIGGVLLGCASRLGPRPRFALGEIMRPGLLLLFVMGMCSLVAGIAGYALAVSGSVEVPSSLANEIPQRSHDRFVADWWAHLAAYGSGAISTLVLCGWIVWQRLGGRAIENESLAIAAHPGQSQSSAAT